MYSQFLAALSPEGIGPACTCCALTGLSAGIDTTSDDAIRSVAKIRLKNSFLDVIGCARVLFLYIWLTERRSFFVKGINYEEMLRVYGESDAEVYVQSLQPYHRD